MTVFRSAISTRRRLLLGTAALAGARLPGTISASSAKRLNQGHSAIFEKIGSTREVGITSPVSLTEWNDRVYIGEEWLGNSSPIPAVYLDMATIELIHDESFFFDEEAVEEMAVFGEALYVPGVDALEPWDFGNIYRRTLDFGWEKLRTVPGAVHLYGIGFLNGVLTVSGSDAAGTGIIWQSWDYGQSWAVMQTFPNLDARGYWLAVYSHIATFEDRLAVITARNGLFTFDGSTWSSIAVDDVPSSGLKGAEVFGPHTVLAPYTSSATLNTRMDRLYLLTGTAISSIDMGDPVMDAVVGGERLYVLVDRGRGAGAILATRDVSCACLDTFEEIATIPTGRPRSLLATSSRLLVGCDDGTLLLSSELQAGPV